MRSEICEQLKKRLLSVKNSLENSMSFISNPYKKAYFNNLKHNINQLRVDVGNSLGDEKKEELRTLTTDLKVFIVSLRRDYFFTQANMEGGLWLKIGDVLEPKTELAKDLQEKAGLLKIYGFGLNKSKERPDVVIRGINEEGLITEEFFNVNDLVWHFDVKR